ncbi:hypothetical protein DSO57_1000594 [Entomophthora muscae]|uniref:Uncharacterized protein n=1 Tax=Entomophthora muscae TaxID=34485 RepID=A0ACC2S0B5_9FUNG|nr:hypothetical protein DSO57_1000594 [Entomophthora muscae]
MFKAFQLTLKQASRKVAIPNISLQRGNSTKSLFVTNIPYVCKKSEIHEIFSEYGPIYDLNYPTDKLGRHRGFAFVKLDEEKADKAVVMLCGKPIDDQCIKVVIAEEREPKQKPDL